MPASELPANAYYQQQRKRPPPPIDWLRERFEYDPETGIIWHRQRDLFGNRKRADTRGKRGYRQVQKHFDGESHAIAAHRLAYALMTGRWPTLIDHIDRDPANNSWANLREVSPSQNNRNSNACDCPKMITKRKEPEYRQGFAWRIQRRPTDGRQENKSQQSTTRRDFCAAWKVRQAWLAERNNQEARG